MGSGAYSVFIDQQAPGGGPPGSLRRVVPLPPPESWSAPCLAELRRLQRLQETGKGTPFIVAFHGGNNSDALDEIRKRLGLSFALVQDSRQQIARRYGVRCWPTTILVGADGRAEHIQFGIGHEQIRTPEQLQPAVRPA
jgi:peroxiredoxin